MATANFSYTGSAQTWTVPAGVNRVTVDAYGAEGFDRSGSANGHEGGLGGRAQGVLSVTPGETLRIYVGGQPASGSGGGWNGGGAYGGGGGTDVRRGSALSGRVIVAGGGGGGAISSAGGEGGSGGGGLGGNGGGQSLWTGKGATQVAGGAAGNSSAGSTDGAIGVGGSGASFGSAVGGGGGGGLYGGGGGGTSSGQAGGGGGGSGYTGGVMQASMTSGVKTGNGSVTFTYEANVAPNAPTVTSPSVGQTVDVALPFRVAWQFNDDNPGDSQSQFDLQIRPQGSATLTVDVTEGTANSFRDLSAGTLSTGDYELRVRTYDSWGWEGSWSSWVPFTVVTRPAGPSITAPTSGSTIPTETYPVVWSAAAQDDWQLRRVADDDGEPDTSTIYFDTGTVPETSTRTADVTFETNGRVEWIQVRVRRDGLWSPWAQSRVTVSYTGPAVPEVEVDDTSVSGAILVRSAHPDPDGQPAVTHVDVWRRDSPGDGIRVCAGCAPSGTFTDWAVASGVEYSYRVRTYGDNGTSVWSDWSETSGPFTGAFFGGAFGADESVVDGYGGGY